MNEDAVCTHTYAIGPSTSAVNNPVFTTLVHYRTNSLPQQSAGICTSGISGMLLWLCACLTPVDKVRKPASKIPSPIGMFLSPIRDKTLVGDECFIRYWTTGATPLGSQLVYPETSHINGRSNAFDARGSCALPLNDTCGGCTRPMSRVALLL
jgi:hypothetical protein